MAMRLYANNEAADTGPVFTVRERMLRANRDCDNIKPTVCTYANATMSALFFFLSHCRNRFPARKHGYGVSDFSLRSRKIDRYRSITGEARISRRDEETRTDLSGCICFICSRRELRLFPSPLPFYIVMLFV